MNDTVASNEEQPSDSLPSDSSPKVQEDAPKMEEGTNLDRLQRDLEEVKRDVHALLHHLGSHEDRPRSNGVRDGAAALESATESALATISSREWIDTGAKWIRDVPVVSVLGSVLFGWTLASALRR